MYLNKITLEKLQRLRSIYLLPEDQRSISRVETELQRVCLQARLAELDVVKDIVKHWSKELDDISQILAHDESLTEGQRGLLFKERSVCMRHIRALDGKTAQSYINSIEKSIETKL